MEFLQSIRRPFHWRELLRNILLFLVPLINLGVYGYILRIAGKASEHNFKEQDPGDRRLLIIISFVFLAGAGIGNILLETNTLAGAVVLFLAIFLTVCGFVVALLTDSVYRSDFLFGIGMLAIALIYFLPSIAMLGFLLLYPKLGNIGLVLMALFSIAGYYVIPSAQIRYSIEGTFKSAFDFQKLAKCIFRLEWLLAFIVSLFWALILTIVAVPVAILSILTLVGPVVVYALLGYCLAVTSYAFYGEAYQK